MRVVTVKKRTSRLCAKVKRLAVMSHVHVVQGKNTSNVTENWPNYFSFFVVLTLRVFSLFLDTNCINNISREHS